MSPENVSDPILLFGGDGQVGREIRHCAADQGVRVIPLGRDKADLSKPGSIRAVFAEFPCRAVVNAAAYTAVDKAQSDGDAAFAVNRDGPGILAQACHEHGLPLIHYSTDYVFDGRKSGPYGEDDAVNPLSVYGASKAAGEEAVRKRCAQHIILRTSWVYSVHGHNFVKTMLRLGAERPALSIVGDQTGCPTSARSIAQATLSILRSAQPRWGTYHFCGAGLTSWYGLAQEIFRVQQELTGQAGPELTPVATTDYPTPAPRPANSALDCRRIYEHYGIEPAPWQGELRAVLEELHSLGSES